MAYCVKMAKKTTKPRTLQMGAKEEGALLEECQKHERDSYNWLATKRDTWDDKESMLICKLGDQLSGTAKSQVFDPILSTLCMDRAARVMARPPTGKAYAVSKNDLGKNMLMNLLLKYFRENAEEQYSHLLKLRLLDFNSAVYGSAFGIVPWRVNKDTGYIGPELLLLPMRSVRPQPGKKSIDESEWFGVKTSASLTWLLKEQKDHPGIWKNVEKLAAEIKEKKAGGDKPEERSYIEEEWYPSLIGDAVFPAVDIVTEYRRDRWITWTPRQIDNKKSRPWVLRIVENPYPEKKLPIVVKHAFPLLDSLIGLGEFERGQTLQFAVNSLINLYLDGVKYSIFPPLHVDPASVIMSSLKWGAGEMWFMNNPNRDVQPMSLSPQGLQTFQSTYSFMMTAIHNLMGSTQVTKMEGTEPSIGKTPEAIKYMTYRESARDDWDRFMMEDTVDQIYTRWITLITHNLKADQTIRIYGPEIEEIQKLYPDEDIMEVFESGKRANLRINKEFFTERGEPVKFDYELIPRSSMRASTEDEAEFLSQILMVFLKAPRLIEEVRARGKDIDFAELVKRLLIASPVKDWEKIIVEPEQQFGAGGMVTTPTVTTPTGGASPVTGGASPGVPTAASQFQDQEIAAVAQQIFGGIGGIPARAK